MSFSDAIRKEVMEKAGYCCCICHQPSVSVEVHHIIPESKCGSDLIDNAAPLCPSCHSDFGGNPEKRKRIKQMRDWWYERIKEMYSGNITNPKQLGQIHASVQNLLEKQNKHDSDLMALRTQLKEIANKSIDNMTPATSDITTSAVLNTAVSSSSLLRSREKYGPVPISYDGICIKCGNRLDCPTPPDGDIRYAQCDMCGMMSGVAMKPIDDD